MTDIKCRLETTFAKKLVTTDSTRAKLTFALWISGLRWIAPVIRTCAVIARPHDAGLLCFVWLLSCLIDQKNK